MNSDVMAKVENYLDLFKEILEKTSDDRVALTILQEVAKDRRMDQMREEREVRNNGPATRRQVGYLNVLGVEMTPGLTKRQASRLIDEAVAKESV